MKNEVIETGPFAGFEVIHRYTRKQAIADGVLVDVTEQAKRCGFVVPVAMTSSLFEDCKAAAEDGAWWLLCFACETIRASKQRKDTDRLPLSLAQITRQNKTANVHMGPGDDAEPVVTLMYPGDE